MFTVTALTPYSAHITEGHPERSMLYRYGILARDTDCADAGPCTLAGDTVTLRAGREVGVTIVRKPDCWRLVIPMREGERFFGAGDSTRKSFALRGQLIQMYIKNVVGYGPMPVVYSTDGWALVLNCTYRSIFDFGTKDPGVLTIDALGGDADFYLFRGDSLKDLLAKVTKVTGRPMILPKFAYGLTFVQNEQTDARSLLWDIRTLRDRDIPCDTMGLEPAWMSKHYDYSVSKEWNKALFPLPSWKPANNSNHFTFFYPMRKMGMQLSLWLCQNYDLLYEEEKEAPLSEPSNFPPEAEIVDRNLAAGTRIDTITRVGEPWFEHLKKFVDNGAAAFKLDGALQVVNHPDRLWAEKFTDDEVHNVYPVILAKQMANGFRDYTGRRLLLYSSGAYVGTQKYAATWAGDTGGGDGTVVSLLNYAMCGHSNTACDIDVDPAGLHYGFLLPWSQYFCWANWRYPWFLGEEIEDMVRFYAKLRSSLVPYIYTMAYKAYAEALPVLRPLPLMYEGDERFDDVRNAYMLGDSLYVGVFDMDLKLPRGRWIDWFTGAVYEGGGSITYQPPEGKGGALFVKEGSILVTMVPQKYVLEKQPDYIVGVWPSRTEDCAFTLFEDDGFTYDYEQGLGCFTTIRTADTSAAGYTLVIEPRRGTYPGRPDNGHDITQNSIPKISPAPAEKDMTVELHGVKPARILCGGTDVAFTYADGKAVFTAKTAGRGDRELRFEVKY